LDFGEHLALEIMKIVFLRLTACLFRNTSCRPPASSNSNIFPMLFTSCAQEDFKIFEFLLIFSILIQLLVGISTSLFLFCNFTFNHYVPRSFPDIFTIFLGLTSRTSYISTIRLERLFVNECLCSVFSCTSLFVL
jgi:hypothetical protein